MRAPVCHICERQISLYPNGTFYVHGIRFKCRMSQKTPMFFPIPGRKVLCDGSFGPLFGEVREWWTYVGRIAGEYDKTYIARFNHRTNYQELAPLYPDGRWRIID